MQVGVVNCAAYTDVCSLFDISIYPTIKIRFELIPAIIHSIEVHYRKEGENNWQIFEGIFTTKRLTAALNGTTTSEAVRYT